MWTGDLSDDEESARAYLEVEAGKLRVYRCPSCGVRVANEADVCRAASLKRKAYGATFRQTFNLLEWGLKPHSACMHPLAHRHLCATCHMFCLELKACEPVQARGEFTIMPQ